MKVSDVVCLGDIVRLFPSTSAARAEDAASDAS
jgi:hypothetical protein